MNILKGLIFMAVSLALAALLRALFHYEESFHQTFTDVLLYSLVYKVMETK